MYRIQVLNLTWHITDANVKEAARTLRLHPHHTAGTEHNKHYYSNTSVLTDSTHHHKPASLVCNYTITQTNRLHDWQSL